MMDPKTNPVQSLQSQRRSSLVKIRVGMYIWNQFLPTLLKTFNSPYARMKDVNYPYRYQIYESGRDLENVTTNALHMVHTY